MEEEEVGKITTGQTNSHAFYKQTNKQQQQAFVCPICQRSYAEGRRLQEHIRRKHPKDPNALICKGCGSRFTNVASKDKHIKNSCKVVHNS
jgi:C4-type Zn-finger protein